MRTSDQLPVAADRQEGALTRASGEPCRAQGAQAPVGHVHRREVGTVLVVDALTKMENTKTKMGLIRQARRTDQHMKLLNEEAAGQAGQGVCV